jgi:hypothetical protein
MVETSSVGDAVLPFASPPETGDARLGDLELRFAHPVAVIDPDLVISDPLT